VSAGRQGLPKKRLLRCDHMVKRLYWDTAPSTPSAKHNSLGFLTSKRNLQMNDSISDFEILAELPSEDKSILLTEVTDVRKGTDEDPSEVSCRWFCPLVICTRV
jgi:hypothetical protein